MGEAETLADIMMERSQAGQTETEATCIIHVTVIIIVIRETVCQHHLRLLAGEISQVLCL